VTDEGGHQPGDEAAAVDQGRRAPAVTEPREVMNETAPPRGVGGEQPDTASLQVLLAEYAMLQSALKLSWDLTQQRTTVFFTVLSATAVATGLVAQASGGTFLVLFAVIALAVALFVGLSTFVRVVEALQEVVVIILGMNRIRRFMRDAAAPQYGRLFSLPVNDDEASLHRGIGGMYGHGAEGMRRGYGVMQVPGVIAAVNAAIAGIAVTVVVTSVSAQTTAILIGASAFVVVLAVLLRHWRRATDQIRASLEPAFPSDASRPGGGHPAH
jgi:hypothetical protein